ncbi:MAG: hypothetical protein M1826_006865 [Phylliscum demangeonii]|nr:MAG: hypothetical protein M1826_006865 [Phylliscum demangeonii]
MHLLGLSLIALQSLHALTVPLAPARTEAGVLHRRSEGGYRYPYPEDAHEIFLQRGWWHLDGTINYENYPWDQHGRLKPQYLQEAQACLEDEIDYHLSQSKYTASPDFSVAWAIERCQEYAGGAPKVTDAMRVKLQLLSDREGEIWEPPDDNDYEEWEWDTDMATYEQKAAEAAERYGTKPRRKYTWVKWRQPGDGAAASAPTEKPPVADDGPLAFAHAALHPVRRRPTLEEKTAHVLRLSSAHHPLPAAVARALKAQLGTYATQPKGSLPSFKSVGAYVEWKKQLIARESRRLSAAQPAPSFFSTLARQARGSIRRVESTAASVERAAQHSLSSFSRAKAAPGWSPVGAGVGAGVGGGGGRAGAVAPPLHAGPVVPEF